MGAVVVKGGVNGANLFEYVPSAKADTGLYAPCNTTDGLCASEDFPQAISFVAFCWNQSDIDGKCWEGETAWAVGTDFNFNTRGGSWAMYVPYSGSPLVVDLRAGGGDGEGEIVGTVRFERDPIDPDDVLITVTLRDGVIFYHEAASEDADGEHNIKIQGYNSPPSGNPKIGRFEGKSMVIGESTGSVTMPYFQFFAVHVDVAIQVDCEEEE